MKKKATVLIASIMAFCGINTAHADEGMWTIYNLPNAVYEMMQREGFSMTYDQLYNGENALKNAVVNFSGYCSGVVVSPDGLVFTNHHCGFEAIRSHSTVEHDYMLNGFFAKSYAEELPNENMFVSFMVEQKDVTDKVMSLGYEKLDNKKRDELIDSLENEMTKEVKKNDSTLISPFSLSTRATSGTLLLTATSPTCVWFSPYQSLWVSLVAIQTTGCGLARPATSLYSASMPTQRPMVLLPTARIMCLIILSVGHRFLSRVTRMATMR